MVETTQNSWIGKTLAGRYLIERKLGAGAMGAVFVANQLSMDRKVALKLLHANLQGSENLARRFEREMKATSKVDHQNTVRVYDFGETEEGKLYLAMELVNGRSLREAISITGVFDIPRALHIAIQIGKALNAAHSEGIVHRDLKPDNVMLMDRYGENDFVKVLDFGIARFVDESSTQLTTEGQVVGTPLYIAPEQAHGKQVDHRADIYALGVMLYELIVGQVPFTSETLIGLLLMHAQEPPPPPSEVVPGRVPPHVEAVILNLLEKDPAARPQTANDVVALLEETLATVGPGSAHHGKAGVPSPTLANPGRAPKGRGSTVGLGLAPVPQGVETAVGFEGAPTKSKKGLLIVVIAAFVIVGTIIGLAAAGVFSGSADPGESGTSGETAEATTGDDGKDTEIAPKPAPEAAKDAGPGSAATNIAKDVGKVSPQDSGPTPTKDVAKVALAVQEDASATVDTGPGAGDAKSADSGTKDTTVAATTLDAPAVAKLRVALTNAQKRMGDPPAPKRCQTTDPDVLSVLVRVAGFLEKVTLNANSTLDGLALQQLESVAKKGAESAEYWSFVALAKLSTQGEAAIATAPLNATQATGLCGEWAVTHRLLGNSAFRNKDYPGAIGAYKRALALRPNYPKVRANLAFAYSLANKHAEVVEIATEILKKTPKNLEMLDIRYYSLAALNRPAEAEADLVVLLTMKPNKKDYWFNLGGMRAAQKKGPSSIEAFCKAKALGHAEAAKFCMAASP